VGDLSGLTDKQLDDAYAAYAAAAARGDIANSQAPMVAIADEIQSRLSSLYSFLTGYLGAADRFPQYDQLTHFGTQADAAQSAVADNAKKVAQNIADAAGTVLSPFLPLFIAAAALGGIVLYAKFKK